jgi:zinc transport system permease protein
MTLFQYDFLVYALIGALLTGMTAPAIGIYLVQRRLSLIGDGLGHVALTGVGLGLLLRQSPVLVAVLVAATGAVVIELVRQYGKTSGDVALAMLFYGGIAGGVVLVSKSDSQNSKSLVSYLFGSALTIEPAELVVMAVLAAAVLAITVLGRPWLFAVSHDEEYARVSGLPVRALNLTIAITTALTVTVAMRAVGLLLVSALMVVPVATAQLVSRGFRATMAVAIGLGMASAAGGVWLAQSIDTGVGATVVLLAIAGFFVVAIGTAVARRAGRAATHTDECPPEVVLDHAN